MTSITTLFHDVDTRLLLVIPCVAVALFIWLAAERRTRHSTPDGSRRDDESYDDYRERLRQAKKNRTRQIGMAVIVGIGLYNILLWFWE